MSDDTNTPNDPNSIKRDRTMPAVIFAPSKVDRIKELTGLLAVEEDYIMSFFQVCPDMLCVLDHNKRIVLANDAWETILGYDSTFLITRELSELVNHKDIVATDQIIHSLKESKVVRFYTHCTAKSGDTIPLEWNIVLSEDGNIYAAARNIPHECVECERARQNSCAN